MIKNVLITGGAGFIGSNIALKLIQKGYRVTVLDSLSKQIHGENPEKDSPLYKSIIGKVNFISGNVVSKNDWLKALTAQDAVIHLAAETGTGQSMYEIKRYCDINIGSTSLMLDILTNEKHSIKKVIVASSRAIYGEGKYLSSKYGFVYPEYRSSDDMSKGLFEPTYFDDKNLKPCATDEDSKIHPSSVYGISKQVQEQLVNTVCKSLGISSIAYRYQNVYGPGQSLKNPYTGILSIFSSRILNGLPISIFEDGNESRDFIYIDDVVEATIAGLENESVSNEFFNVGTGISTTVLEVVESLIKNYNKIVDYKISGNFRVGDIRHNYADITKIKSKLGFVPKVSFNEGIKNFTSWVLQQPLTINNYEESISEMKEKGLFK